MRPVNFDVVADARGVRLGRSASFGRVTLTGPGDARPVGTVTCAFAMT
jgi:acyl-coenzyme A thioesterase PaaI-like protein